jgi:large subunit ribosomal protein L19e
MKLDTKKHLAARTLKVGIRRISFNQARLEEIKEAITKQDIKDLLNDKAITIKEISGRKTIKKRKTRRRVGSKKQNVKSKKRIYMTITRKLRSYLSYLKKVGKIDLEKFTQLRKEIRASSFKSLSHLKDRIKEDN